MDVIDLIIAIQIEIYSFKMLRQSLLFILALQLYSK
jgi:hypothetical protein